MLPPSFLDELATLPSSIANSHRTIDFDLMGQYTGLDLMVESRVHLAALQRRLTPRLDVITPALQDELTSALDVCFADVTASEWKVFTPHKSLNYMSARLSSYVLVGPAFCRDPAWLDLAIEYPKNRESAPFGA